MIDFLYVFTGRGRKDDMHAKETEKNNTIAAKAIQAIFGLIRIESVILTQNVIYKLLDMTKECLLMTL